MTLLSRKADYALLILAYLHRHPAASAREVAGHYDLSRGFIANILKELCAAGFLTSQRGANGGYGLARRLNDVSLGELLTALDDEVNMAACSRPESSDDHACSVSAVCPVKAPVRRLHERVQQMLHGVTLAELLDDDPGPAILPPPALKTAELANATV